MATGALMSSPNSHASVLCVDSAQHEGSLTSILKAQEVPFAVANSTDEALPLHGERHRVTLIAAGARGSLCQMP